MIWLIVFEKTWEFSLLNHHQQQHEYDWLKVALSSWMRVDDDDDDDDARISAYIMPFDDADANKKKELIDNKLLKIRQVNTFAW